MSLGLLWPRTRFSRTTQARALANNRRRRNEATGISGNMAHFALIKRDFAFARDHYNFLPFPFFSLTAACDSGVGSTSASDDSRSRLMLAMALVELNRCSG